MSFKSYTGLMRRVLRALRRRWQTTSAALSPEPPATVLDEVAAYFPKHRELREQPLSSPPLEGLLVPAAAEPDLEDRRGTCMVSVCSQNYLHFARALIESFRRHHPGMEIFLAVADWDGREPLPLDGAVPLAGSDLCGPFFPHMALKYTASEMCCALKPYAINHVVARTRFERILYLDSDIYVFAPFERLLEELDRGEFVVTPHTFAPLSEAPWERPSLGDLAHAGVFNAGLFGVRVTAGSKRFLDTWQDLVTRPGAFVPEYGGQMEQHSFNWVTCFADGVRVLRDPAYNVAYWNLHDRSVRCKGLDDEKAALSWTIDGQPLVAFHFSGFSPYLPYRLSKFDARKSLYILPSVARLCDFYTARLFALGAGENREREYRYDRFPSGIRIDERMRMILKEHETYLGSGLDPWTEEGEAYYCKALLSPIPYTTSLLPALFDPVYRDRIDLHAAFPHARQHPDGLVRWIAACGVYEFGYEEIFDRYRTALPTRHGAVILGRVRQDRPEVFEGLPNPLGADRHRLLARLADAGQERAEVAVRTGEVEHYYISTIRRIQGVLEERPDVQRAFPDLFFSQARAFAEWLEQYGVPEHFLPPHAPQLFLAKAEGRSLARIFSYFNRTWYLMDRWPLALVGEGRHDFAIHLFAVLRHGLELDQEDVFCYLWMMEAQPWTGIPLTLELACNARRKPSPLLPEGQEQLLGPVLGRDPRFRRALQRYREDHATPRHRLQEKLARQGTESPPAVSVFRTIERVSLRQARAAIPGDAPAERAHLDEVRFPAPLERGVNLFGYHKSPIGLGNLTRGLHAALREASFPVDKVVLGNVAMDADLSPGDFVRTWNPTLDTNIFVSYPHLHEMLLESYPEHMTAGRRNIVYLAWEQRDGSHYWPEVYAGFDQIWALSDFAARSFRRFMEREVHAIPCVLDFDEFPAPATKEAAGLDPDRFTFLYVFDANSSVERKNPEAAISAFSQAFSPADPVRLVLRVSNAHRLENRERLKRMLSAASPGLDLQFILQPLRRADLLRLFSAVDCYVSLHRAEGFGYTCAEAMAYGKPVIATGYSGNLEFMSRENSYLVDFVETEVAVADGPFQRGSIWAEPSVEHAAHLMRTVFEEREAAARRGEQAWRDVREILSAEAVGRRVSAVLGGQHHLAPRAQAAPFRLAPTSA